MGVVSPYLLSAIGNTVLECESGYRWARHPGILRQCRAGKLTRQLLTPWGRRREGVCADRLTDLAWKPRTPVSSFTHKEDRCTSRAVAPHLDIWLAPGQYKWNGTAYEPRYDVGNSAAPSLPFSLPPFLPLSSPPLLQFGLADCPSLQLSVDVCPELLRRLPANEFGEQLHNGAQSGQLHPLSFHGDGN